MTNGVERGKPSFANVRAWRFYRHTTIYQEVYKMNWNQNQGILQELINNVKDRWIWFIDDQIDVLDGKQSHFYGKSQKVYVIDNDEAEKRLADWQKCQRDKIPS